jgi:integrase
MTDAILARWRANHRASTAHTYRIQLVRIARELEQFGAPKIHIRKLPRGAQRATVATGDELARILKDPVPWLRLFILLYLQCGLRRGEAMRVTPRSWNAENHTVTIAVKGGRIRTAEITPDVEALFLAAGNDPEPDKSFIQILHGRKIGMTAVYHAWQKHKKKHGINPAVTTHDLRRTAATILYAATKDLRVPQQLLGHKHLASTLSYLAPLAPDEARRYAELLRFDRFHTEVKQ